MTDHSVRRWQARPRLWRVGRTFSALVGSLFWDWCVPWLTRLSVERSAGGRLLTSLRTATGGTGDHDRALQAASPGDPATGLLRQRYALGELTQEQFREHLVDLLKERYVSGKIDQGQYEDQLEVLLRPPPLRE